MNSIAEMIGKIQGAALVVDYGEKHAFSNSVRAIRKHKIMDSVLAKPGDCDISAYIDFGYVILQVCEFPGIGRGGHLGGEREGA